LGGERYVQKDKQKRVRTSEKLPSDKNILGKCI